MAMKVAVLGPKDIVDKIINEGKNFNKFVMTANDYKSESDVTQIIGECINHADLILFTGPIPYYLARKEVKTNIPMLYVSYSGTAFYKALFKYLENVRWSYRKPLRFSIDTMHKDVVEEMLIELDIIDYELYVCECNDYVSSEEIVDYHYKLFKEDKVEFIITCLTSAYEKLSDLGIPAYRIIPTVTSIRETLNIVNVESQNFISKKAQLCIGVMKILNWDSLDKYSPSEYKQSRMKLSAMEIFINFCENIKASMEFKNDDEYIFYATRGVIENITNNYSYMPVIQQITEKLPFKICMGLGYGYYANEAEKNSRDALEYAKNYNKNCCYVIMEDGKVRGPLGEGRIIEFYSSEQESKVMDIVKKSNLSAASVNKILGVVNSYGKDTITAVEIAKTLNITLRSARRILNNLEKSGIAKVVGEELNTGRGRPRQIYKITL